MGILSDCINIKNQRQEIYGNSWFTEDGVESNFWGGIINKTRRLRILHPKRMAANSYESYRDCLIDLVNLTLFTLACHDNEIKKMIRTILRGLGGWDMTVARQHAAEVFQIMLNN